MIPLVLATSLNLVAISAVPAQSSLPAERTGVRSSVYRCAIRQDGSLCASVRKDGRVELLNAELDPLHVIAEDLGAQCLDMRFSPDGSRLLLQTDRARLLLWRIEGAEVVSETELIEFSWEWHRPKSYDAEFSWAPDSTRFLTIDSLGHRRLYDRDGTLVRRLDAKGYERRGRGAAWHERSDALLLRDEDGIGVYDGRTGERRWRDEKVHRFPTEFPPTALALSPSGDQLIVGSKSLRLELFDYESGERRRSIQFPHTGLDNPTFLRPLGLEYSPDGKWIAMTSEGGEDTGLLQAETLVVEYSREHWGAHWSEAFTIDWLTTSDRILFGFACGCGGTGELILGEEFAWNEYERLECPRTSARTGIGILDGELTSWDLYE